MRSFALVLLSAVPAVFSYLTHYYHLYSICGSLPLYCYRHHTGDEAQFYIYCTVRHLSYVLILLSICGTSTQYSRPPY
jgi:hypothetical protein